MSDERQARGNRAQGARPERREAGNAGLIGQISEELLAEHDSQLSSYMRMMGMVPPSALPSIKRVAIALPVSALSQYVGVYQVAPGTELHVTLPDGGLLIRSTPGGDAVHLYPESSGDFFVQEKGHDAQIKFTRDASGAVTGLVLHQYGQDTPAKRIQ